MFYIYGEEKFGTWAKSQIHDCVFPRLYAADELILNIKQREIDNYIEEKNKQLEFGILCGHVFGYVFAENHISELGNKLCLMNTAMDFVAIINPGAKTVSYRTVKDGIHLGNDIAAKFGGGGHAKAAGSQFDANISANMMKSIFGTKLEAIGYLGDK